MDCSILGSPLLHNLQSVLKFMSIEKVTLSNHLILCYPLLFLPSVFPIQFSCSVMSNSLQLHGLQARLPYPSPTPGAYSNSCPPSQWCHPTTSSCRSGLFLPSIFPSIMVFSSESVLHIRWPKDWSFSFSINPSNEYSDWFPLGLTSWNFLQSKGLKSLL